MDESDDDAEDDDDEDDYAGPAQSRKGRVRKSVGTSDTRNKKLKELSENRKKKAASRSSRTHDDQDDDGGRKARRSSSDSEEETEESEGYVGSDDDDRRARRAGGAGRRFGAGRGQRRAADEGPYVAPELDDVNKARIGRNDIVKTMYRRGWEDKLVGNFVRVVADPKRDERTGKMVPRYRAYEVIDWKQGHKWYQVDEGKFTNVLLVLQFADQKHQKEIIYVSNSDITDEEFQRYLLQSQNSPNRSSKSQTLEQAEIWSDFTNEPWTEEEFTAVLKARKEAKQAAEQQGRIKPSNGASDGSNGTAATGAKTEDVLLAELNERNRKADRERIQQATKKQAEMRRAAALAAAQREQALSQSTSGNGSPTKSNGDTQPISQPNGGSKTIGDDLDIDLGEF